MDDNSGLQFSFKVASPWPRRNCSSSFSFLAMRSARASNVALFAVARAISSAMVVVVCSLPPLVSLLFFAFFGHTNSCTRSPRSAGTNERTVVGWVKFEERESAGLGQSQLNSTPTLHDHAMDMHGGAQHQKRPT